MSTMIPHPVLPPIPAGYVYAGRGPLLPLQTSDTTHLQPAGDLSAFSVERADRGWPDNESLSGQFSSLYYCVRVDSTAYHTLREAGHWSDLTSVPAVGWDYPPVPAGYIYAGRGPLNLPTATGVGDQPVGDLAVSDRYQRNWGVDIPYNGLSTNLHYCVRIGCPAYFALRSSGFWPAIEAERSAHVSSAAPALPEGLPPVPEGYDYVGVGPLWPDLDPHTAPLRPRNDLQLHLVHPVTGQSQGWLENSGLNGQARGTHYCARRGSEVHRLLLPHLHTTPEPIPPEPPVEADEDELPAGHVRTYDGEVLPEEDAVQIVRRGHCGRLSNYDGQYHGRSRGFELSWARADDEDIHWLERESCYAHTDCDIVTLSDGEFTFSANAVRLSDGDYYHEDDVRYDGNGNPFHEDDDEYVACSDGEYWHRDDCHYCDHNDEWVYGDADGCDCSSCSGSDTHVNEYHGSPSPYFHTGPNPSGWGLGFEVEKNEVNGADDEGDYVGSYPLFSGWERDASCGIEGITHVYDPLTAADKFRADADASRAALNAPSDKTCGGHINISHPSLPPRHLLQSLRTYAPLWYAIYRHRLNNSYCIEDKKVEHGSTKYSPLRTKSFGVEFRLPSGVRNHDQLVRRFELMSLVCQAIDAGWSLNRYVKECRQLLLHGAYEGDRNKYAKILRLTRHFNRWFQDGHIHADIAQYV